MTFEVTRIEDGNIYILKQTGEEVPVSAEYVAERQGFVDDVTDQILVYVMAKRLVGVDMTDLTAVQSALGTQL